MQPDLTTIHSLKDLEPDAHNANRHTPRGTAAMEDSIRAYGYGDSMTVDRAGRIISGNQRAETLADLGLTDAIVVRTDGTKPIIHQRIDLDLETDPRAKALAIAQNRVGEVNLDWDVDVLQALQSDGVDLSHLWRDDELAALFAAAQGPMSGSERPRRYPRTPAHEYSAGRFVSAGTGTASIAMRKFARDERGRGGHGRRARGWHVVRPALWNFLCRQNVGGAGRARGR